MDIIAEDASITRSFNTVRFSSGAPFALAGTPSMHARVNGGVTQITAGFTLTADFDSITGENQWVLDTSASASFTAGARVEVFIAAGTVDSVSVVGLKVYEFIIGTTTSLDAAITRLMAALPNAAPAANGGLPTVNGSNYIAGVQGTINTLDALDTAQDSQHSTTQSAVADVPTVTEFEARTLLAAEYGTAANQTTLLNRRHDLYPDNSIWLANSGGTAGTTLGTHGTYDTPSDTWANAKTLADAFTHRIQVRSHSAAGNGGPPSAAGVDLTGTWIDLNEGAIIVNTSTTAVRTLIRNGDLIGSLDMGYGARLEHVAIVSGGSLNIEGDIGGGEASIYLPSLYDVKISTLTFTDIAASAKYHFEHCHSRDDESTINYTDAANPICHAEFTEWQGAMQLTNFPNVAHKIWVSGTGKLTIAASCLGGTVYVGHGIEVVNNGAMTVEVWSADPTAVEIADAYLDRADGIETGITPRQAMRAKLAMLAGVIITSQEGTEVFKNPGGGTTRVTVTVDSEGNRSAVVINA